VSGPRLAVGEGLWSQQQCHSAHDPRLEVICRCRRCTAWGSALTRESDWQSPRRRRGDFGRSRRGRPYFSVVVLRLRTTPVYGFAHVVEYKDRDSRHALPLFGTKCFIEWLPRLGELIHIG
jgi:hypothetical protein